MLLLLHAASTLYLAGLIWFVQVVHYPLMRYADAGRFSEFERAHVRRTGWIVGPAMLTEGITALYLVWNPPARAAPGTVWIGLGLLAIVWTSTALLQVPCHRRLERGFDAAIHRKLVRGNWVRTVGWSLRSVLCTWWIVAADSIL